MAQPRNILPESLGHTLNTFPMGRRGWPCPYQEKGANSYLPHGKTLLIDGGAAALHFYHFDLSCLISHNDSHICGGVNCEEGAGSAKEEVTPCGTIANFLASYQK